jgi:hypothetical protein
MQFNLFEKTEWEPIPAVDAEIRLWRSFLPRIQLSLSLSRFAIPLLGGRIKFVFTVRNTFCLDFSNGLAILATCIAGPASR